MWPSSQFFFVFVGSVFAERRLDLQFTGLLLFFWCLLTWHPFFYAGYVAIWNAQTKLSALFDFFRSMLAWLINLYLWCPKLYWRFRTSFDHRMSYNDGSMSVSQCSIPCLLALSSWYLTSNTVLSLLGIYWIGLCYFCLAEFIPDKKR